MRKFLLISGVILGLAAMASPIYAQVITENIQLGDGALERNTTGVRNIALGPDACYENRQGVGNVCIGYASLYFNTGGSYNVAVGDNALRSNTTGNYNIAYGVDALRANTTGWFNTAMNYDALHNNTTGGGNTAEGPLAFYENTTGNENTGLGFAAGRNNVTGGKNTCIGYQSCYNMPAALDNAFAIGYQSVVSESNKGTIGNAATAEIRLWGAALLTEMPTPAAPGQNQVLFFAQDDGTGKTQFCVRFATGEPMCLATQP